MESGPTDGQKKALVSRRGQGGGPASQVDASEWEVWRDYLQQQSVQHWTSSQLADVLEKLTGVRYSHSHWSGPPVR